MASVFLRDVKPSRATFLFNGRPPGPGDGSGFVIFNGRQVLVIEDDLEAKILQMLMVNWETADIVDRPPPVAYGIGRASKHLFNYVVVLAGGQRYAVTIRNECDAEKLKGILPEVGRRMSRAYADRLLLLTERNVSPSASHNAELILAMRRFRHGNDAGGDDENARSTADDDFAALEVVRRMYGTTSLQYLVGLIGREGRGFGALVRLIDDGVLELADPDGCIEYSTLVRKSGREPVRPIPDLFATGWSMAVSGTDAACA